MPKPRISLRMIKDVIRLKWQADLSHEQVAATLNISKGAVAKSVLPARPRPADEPRASTHASLHSASPWARAVGVMKEVRWRMVVSGLLRWQPLIGRSFACCVARPPAR